MLIYTTKESLTLHLSAIRKENKSIGLVPTMGAIHDGHLSLVSESIKDNDCTVISIFVNPNQFNNAEDLEKYPRNLERDVENIHKLSKEIIIFAPSVEEIYDEDSSAESFDYDGLEFEMEGAQRPGHFNGVGTIIKKLFDIVQPQKAYFGEKDFQQLQIIRKLVDKLNYNVEIVGCPIHRENSGLAMSSRNERLTESGLEKSTFIYKILQESKKRFKTQTSEEVNQYVENEFKNNADFELEYFTIAEEETLKPVINKRDGVKYRGFIVAHIEGIRLIDNISLN